MFSLSIKNNKCKSKVVKTKAVKRAVSSILIAASIITSIPLSSISTAYADNIVGDNGGGGDDGMGSSSDYKKWSNQDQGYRFYILNENGERVSSVYDFLIRLPSSVSNYDFSTRFDTSNSSGYKLLNFETLAHYSGSELSSIPYPVYGGKGQGEEFKNWWMQDVKDGNPDFGTQRNPVKYGDSTSGSDKESAVNDGKNNNNNSNKNNTSNSDKNNSSSKPQVPTCYDEYSPDIKSAIDTGKSVSNKTVLLTIKESQMLSECMQEAKRRYEIGIGRAPSYLSKQEKQYYAINEVYKMTVSSYTKNLAYYVCRYVKNLYYIRTATAFNFNMDYLLNMNIPLAEESKSECPGITFLTNPSAIKVDGYDTAYDALQDGYTLIVEPITWIYIQKSDGSYESGKTYGSYYNIINRWSSLGGSDSGAFYTSYLKTLGNNCMTIGADLEFSDGSKILAVTDHESSRKISETMGLLNQNYGLSMHAYVSPSSGGKDIIVIKNYVKADENGNETVIKNTKHKTGNQISVKDENGFEVVEWKTSTAEHTEKLTASTTFTELLKKAVIKQSGADTADVTLGADELVIYIKLLENTDNINTDLSLSESELSKAVNINSLLSTLKADYTNIGTDYSRYNENAEENRNIMGLTNLLKDKVEYEADGNNVTYKYSFIIYRGEDVVTLDLAHKDEGNELALELFDEGTVSNGLRVKNDYAKGLTISLIPSNSGIAAESIKVDTGVRYEVYSGMETSQDISYNSSEIMSSSGSTKTSGKQIKGTEEISFYPYIRMTVQGEDGVKKNVNVLGEYERTLTVNEFAGFEYRQNENNLTVYSEMWCLDSKVVNGDKEWNGSQKVLKGGATYSVKTESQNVGVVTYQVYTGSEDDITAEHENFVNSALAALDRLEVVQYVNPDYEAENAWSSGGIAVNRGSDISKLKNGNKTASEDSKYYLESDFNNTESIRRADLDVKRGNTKKTYYRVYSDVLGNVYLAEGSSLEAVKNAAGTVILSRIQGIGDLSNGTAIKLNARTGVVSKLVAVLERNTGDDKTASWASSDGHWYNEACEGVIVVRTMTSVKAGFMDYAKRTTVIDPELIPVAESKSDQLTEAFLSQYCVDGNESTVMGVFKGNNIYIKDLQEMFTSNKFYITNGTVQNSR